MRPVRMLIWLFAAALLAVGLVVLFWAYQQPELLIDFTNLVFC